MAFRLTALAGLAKPACTTNPFTPARSNRNPLIRRAAMDSNVHVAKQQLLDDFSKVVADAEGLLKAVREVPGEKTEAMRASVEARLGAAKERLRAIQDTTVEKTAAAARAADTYVHDNPWPLMGAAAVAGFLLGLWVRDSE
jgi:ElaB/YqjD/DUF883 family membrane-anchored ribosome-binding protein